MTYDIPARLMELADWQASAVSRQQLLDAGLTARMIARRLSSGRWQVLHRGVYATFSGTPGRETQLWAAVLRAGDGAVLSHKTAAELHGLIDSPAEKIYVTVPAWRRVESPGLVIRISGRIDQARQANREPPRTTVEETVLDLVQLTGTFDDVCGWITRACSRRLSTEERLRAALAIRKKMRWRAELNDVLAATGDGIHSVLEYRYVRDVERAHGLPRSRHQVHAVTGSKVAYRDTYYPEYRAAVELDGRLAHPDEDRWRDNRRDNTAGAVGVYTSRYSWRDVVSRPCETALLQARILAQRGWRGRPRPCSPGCPVGRNMVPGFTLMASTAAPGFASELMRLGVSGTPSLILLPGRRPGRRPDGWHRRT